MPIAAKRSRTSAHGQDTCNDQVIGAILSGWRYDISGISPELRGDYEEHLKSCGHCKKRQRLHRTVDVLLLAATSLSFAAFLLAAIVMHRVEALSHIYNVHLRLHGEGTVALSRVPESVSVSLKAVAVSGVVVSMLLWVLVAIATPIPTMVSTLVRERLSPEWRERLRKQAA